MVMSASDIEKGRSNAIKACKENISALLDVGRELFVSVFPVAKISPGSGKKFDAHQVYDYKMRQIKSWVNNTMHETLTLAQSPEPLEMMPTALPLPRAVAEEVIEAMIRVFTLGRDLTDNDYYYISDAASAMGLDASTVSKIIDQSQYKVRKAFFEELLEELDAEQCFGCAILLMKAIQADDAIHPAEFKYIENIAQLLENDQSEIERVERVCQDQETLPRVFLPHDLSEYMFKYLTEVVMCDGEYDARETAFIKEVGKAFGFDLSQQDEIIQPVAGALMVKAALFPKV